MNLNEKLKNYLTHEENDFLKVENSYNKKTSYLVGFEFASGSIIKDISKHLELEKETDTSIIATANATDTKSEIISYTFYIRKSHKFLNVILVWIYADNCKTAV